MKTTVIATSKGTQLGWNAKREPKFRNVSLIFGQRIFHHITYLAQKLCMYRKDGDTSFKMWPREDHYIA